MSLLSTIRTDFPEGLMRAYPAGRGDEQFLHVGDLFACPTFVKARLNGAPMLPPSPYVMSMFQMGHAMEDVIVNSIRETLPGAKIERDVLLWVSAHDGDIWGGRLERDAYAHGILMSVGSDRFDGNPLDPKSIIVGHADAIVTLDGASLLVEAKSERFQWTQRPNGQWVAIPPTSPKTKYVEQAAVYAFADQIQQFGVVVGDRVSGGIEWYGEYNTATHIDTLQERIEALIALGTADEMPELKRPVGGFEAITVNDQVKIINTECARCNFGGCSWNANPLKEKALVS